MKILFVCTANVARSPMAEAIFRELAGGDGRHETRSAGLGTRAVHRLTTRDLSWADVVAVMEARHAVEIERLWPDYSRKVHVLGVPDDYDPGEPELRALMITKVRTLVERLDATRGTARSPRPS